MYLGHRTSVLYYNKTIPSWVWFDRKDPSSVAVSISPEASLLLGELFFKLCFLSFSQVFTVLTFLVFEMTNVTLAWVNHG